MLGEALYGAKPRASAPASPPPSRAMIAPAESPRAELAAMLVRLLAAGDLEAARVAHRALGELLGDKPSAAAGVVDLESERRRRGSR